MHPGMPLPTNEAAERAALSVRTVRDVGRPMVVAANDSVKNDGTNRAPHAGSEDFDLGPVSRRAHLTAGSHPVLAFDCAGNRGSAFFAPDRRPVSRIRRFGNGPRSRRPPEAARAAVPRVEEFRSDRDSTC